MNEPPRRQRLRRLSITAAFVGMIGVGTGCSTISDAGRTTRRSAEAAATRLANSPLIEHYGDMNQSNLLQAAGQERLDVASVKGLEQPSGSIYEWNQIVLRFDEQASGFGRRDVVECWKYVFEGKFLRSGPNGVACPTTDPPVIPTVMTVPPSTQSPQITAGFASLQSALSSTLESVGGRAIDEVRLVALMSDAMSDVNVDFLDVAVVDHVAAVAVMYEGMCMFGRSAETVEIWTPAFGSAAATCTADRAAEGGP